MSDTKPTLNAVAEALGVSLYTIHMWRQMGCPGTPGAYSVKAIRDWRRARDSKRRQPPSAPDEPPADLTEAQEAAIIELADYIAAGKVFGGLVVEQFRAAHGDRWHEFADAAQAMARRNKERGTDG